ncbi:unannotated protein [freshwater metagenome]|uniref:Unannotated protein n=1 Tax=freshwater metagenome TaxID=449393 RepID=A0A6J7FQB9_9ZZZZ|nr:hypothetical protein [Actinomycetota bacterium]
MSWFRAILSGVAIVVVAFALLVYVPHLILTHLTGLERGNRVALATAWFVLSLIGQLWGLRRLQSRQVI